MADSADFNEMMRRAVQLNARLYKGWIDLSVEYMRGLAEVFGGESVAADAGDVAADATEAVAGAIVLEADEGAAASGAFLVTNDLGRKLVCDLVASDFVNAQGERVRAQVSFQPDRFELAPGQQQVVTARTKIDGKLAAGVAYTGDFAIKGLDGYTVPAVLRRTHPPVESPITRVTVETATKTAGSAQETRTTQTSKTSSARKRGATKPRK